jgi:hypothetical protein
MKQEEIKKCAHCKQGVMHTGLPLFWRISVERFGIDMQAVQRQHGLELVTGSPVLARVLGPDEDLATPVMDKKEFILCEACSSTPILVILEEIQDDEKREEEEHRRKWNREYIKIILDRNPKFPEAQAKLLAEGEDQAYNEKMTPEDAVSEQIESWSDDGE